MTGDERNAAEVVPAQAGISAFQKPAVIFFLDSNQGFYVYFLFKNLKYFLS
jgi:hypothetical protein